jgi:S-DNA-T family DNA segregation ATPase FtsK/SpoIIIE
MAKKTKTKNILKSVKSFSSEVRENKSLHAAFGLAMIFGGLFILISGISSLLSWEEDFSYLNYDFADILFNPEINLKNSFGKLGAAIGFFITVRSLGWTFLIPISLFIFWGVKILFNFQLRISRFLRIGLLYTLFLSTFTGLISEFPVFNSLNDAIVGDSARFIALWGANLFGKTGTWLIWLAIVLIHVIWFYKLSPQSWKLKPNISETNDDALLEESNIEPGLVDVQEESENSLIEIIDDIDTSSPESSTDSEILDNEQALVSKDNIEDIGLEVADPIDIQSEALEENEDSKMNPGNLKTSYDPKLELSKYVYPTYDLLADVEAPDKVVDADELEANKNRILETLRNYKIEIAKIKAAVGPTVTLYEIIPEAGVRISKIKNLEDDIALSLSALGIRIIAPIPGRGTIGIEVPNRSPKMVSMKSVLTSEKFVKTNMDLPIALGMTISNEVFIADLAKMPHLLMAGATGQGKSVGLNAILASILYKRHPSEVKFVLVDPKKVELTLYNKIERHFLAKLPDTDEAIITDTTKVINTLNSLCIEMDKRYELLKDAMVRNIKEYNQKFSSRKLNPENDHRYLPYIVLVIDEFADLIMTAGKEVETPIARLAQLARAIGIHLIIATQRPSVNVITGIIKANFPARIAFKVSSKIDSRTILDSGGADQLIGKGDMLFSAGNDLIRLQCAFLDTPEVEEVCDFIGSQQAYPDAYALPEYTGEENGSSGSNYSAEERDALFEDAARLVVLQQQGSASLLQRKLKLGYNRAGRLVDQLEDAGIIGPFEGSKARQVLVSTEQELNQRLGKNSSNENENIL